MLPMLFPMLLVSHAEAFVYVFMQSWGEGNADASQDSMQWHAAYNATGCTVAMHRNNPWGEVRKLAGAYGVCLRLAADAQVLPLQIFPGLPLRSV